MRDSSGYWIVIRSTSGQTDCPHTVHCKNIPKDMRTLVSFYLCFAVLASTPLLALPQDSGTEQTEQHIKVDLALSYLQYQSGDIERALATLKACRDQIAKDHRPELYVRSTVLMAGLLNASGQTLESLNMLEELFDAELPEAQAKRVAYARANYASTLSELGRVEDASRAYEQVLVYAQSEANDLLTLIAGTNYIVLLDDLGLSAEAAYWLGQLEPLRARLPNSPASARLELHDLNQLLSSADPESLITKIDAFLASPTTRSDLIVARGLLLYADALRSAGRLDQSLEAAQKALEMLRDYPLRLPDVHFAIVKTLLAKKNFAAAENQLQQAEKLGVLRPTRLVTLHRLRLEHALGIGDTVRGTTAFNAYTLARNALIAQTLEAMLKQEGAQTDWVQSADAAQTKLAAGQEFDLILSDINILGSMNGFDFARWIRSAHPDTQVGIISGYGPTIEQDFDIPILAKPFSREQLLAYLSDRGFAGARTT